MKQEIAELIVDNGYDMDIREDYSGRGMFGDTTTGIVCESEKSFYAAILEIYMEFIEEAKLLGDDYDTSKAEELTNTISRIRVDNMGYCYIFY